MNDSPMSMKEFKQLVREVMDTLPDEIRQHTKNLIVEVSEWPTEDQLLGSDLTEDEVADGASAYGMFEEFPDLNAEFDYTEFPHKLWIFKGPHEEEFGDPERLRTEIRKTVIHELAHHFGWTDRDLERFDHDPDPFA